MIATNSFADAATWAGVTALKPSSRMPVLFVGHGSPMNAIEDTVFRRNWEAMGAHLLQTIERPQLILCISAHWITHGGSHLTGMAQPRTIHDFGGFPQELFAQQYPAPGAPQAAQEIAQRLYNPHDASALGVDTHEWGLDHGTWSVLKPMFPEADIPVVQLSMDYTRPPHEHFALGRQLSALRDKGVLIVGSGNVVHNLRALQRTQHDDVTYDWSLEFDQFVQTQVDKGDLAALSNFLSLGAVAQMAHPTYDHYLPLLYAAGAVAPDEPAQVFNDQFQMASISMRSMIWGHG